MSSSAHSQEIWISNKLNDAWSTPLEYIIFEKKKVKNGLFFPDNFVIESCSNTFEENYVCKSLTDIRKGSVSKDGDGGNIKFKNTGKYVESEDYFWDKIEPKMQIQRGLYEFSIEGDQLVFFHEKKSRPSYFEKFDLKELTDVYLVASILLYPLAENHKCLLKSIREKSFPTVYDNLRKYLYFSTVTDYMVKFMNDPIDPKLLERDRMVQLNLFINNAKLRNWKDSVKDRSSSANVLAGFKGSFSFLFKDYIKMIKEAIKQGQLKGN